MGIRTPDLLIANETLYQLSYTPNNHTKQNSFLNSLPEVPEGTVSCRRDTTCVESPARASAKDFYGTFNGPVSSL